MITLLFGIITVFFGAPGAIGLCLNLGWYFLALALCHVWIVRRLNFPKDDLRRRVLLAAAALLALAGVVIFVLINTTVAAWLGGAALVLAGGAELFASLHNPSGETRKSSLRSDWLISGVLSIGTGVLLPVFIQAGPHGLLGVSGGGALMTGALWLLSALTFRHDARKPKAQ